MQNSKISKFYLGAFVNVKYQMIGWLEIKNYIVLFYPQNKDIKFYDFL